MSNCKENIGSFSGQRGIDIFYRHLPAQTERARLIIAHGLGEHSGRYVNLFERLVPAGFSVWAPDLRGHGRSRGKRGHVDAFDQYVLDLKKLIEAVRSDLPPKRKVFLLGHSMGGLIALNYAQRFYDTIDGVVASSPGLGMNVKVPGAKAFMGKVMSSIWPALSMANGLDAEKISHDPQVVAAYVSDPLVHDRVTARWFTEFLAAMDATNARSAEVRVPVLLQVAGDDHLVNAQTSTTFFEGLAVRDKTIHVYEKLYHEIYNETRAERDVVIDDLMNWLALHIHE
ncbi:MAG: alpha/beta hydrolase [Deltaproteobacteria bacterium]|nr:alpha/beta hydrolase [Deltaproteobacteria bacterium]